MFCFMSWNTYASFIMYIHKYELKPKEASRINNVVSFFRCLKSFVPLYTLMFLFFILKSLVIMRRVLDVKYYPTRLFFCFYCYWFVLRNCNRNISKLHPYDNYRNVFYSFTGFVGQIHFFIICFKSNKNVLLKLLWYLYEIFVN